MIDRPRRLRRTEGIRRLCRETRLSPSMLVYPIFVREGVNIVEEIAAMPGQNRYSPDMLPRRLEEIAEAGVDSVILFGIPRYKDELGSGAWDEYGAVQRALREGKQRFPEMTFISDVCLCGYTSHGHCGVLDDDTVDNDRTIGLLASAAVSHARAGADIVAPSDMMDGRVAAIRSALDESGFDQTAVFSYAVKYASAFYGPFREAAGSAPAFGDRQSYQMSPYNVREAIKETELDIEEGADMVLVKPGMPCLDVIRAVKEAVRVPVGAYNVSGEYAMIKAAAARGWLDEEKTVRETAIALARAGADIIISYFAPELARWLKEEEF